MWRVNDGEWFNGGGGEVDGGVVRWDGWRWDGWKWDVVGWMMKIRDGLENEGGWLGNKKKRKTVRNGGRKEWNG